MDPAGQRHAMFLEFRKGNNSEEIVLNIYNDYEIL